MSDLVTDTAPAFDSGDEPEETPVEATATDTEATAEDVVTEDELLEGDEDDEELERLNATMRIAELGCWHKE